MVEMRVRYVRRHVPSGNDVAVLGPATPAERPMIALTVSRPEALELADELEQHPTPRTGVYDLLVSILGSSGTSLTSIEVTEAPGQSAQARLELAGPRGRSEIQVEVGQAISLSVRIGSPLEVSERLIEAVTPPLRPPASSPPATDSPPTALEAPGLPTPAASDGSATAKPPAKPAIDVDGRRVDIPSFRVRPGMTVTLAPVARRIETVVNELASGRLIPYWLRREGNAGQVIDQPDRLDIELPIDERLVIAFYSRR